jgi:hypothetical protein
VKLLPANITQAEERFGDDNHAVSRGRMIWTPMILGNGGKLVMNFRWMILLLISSALQLHAASSLVHGSISGEPQAHLAANAKCDWSYPDVVECFGAKGDRISDDTATLRAAIVYGEEHNVPIHVPARSYSIVPADIFTNEGGTKYRGAFPLASNLSLQADEGAVFRIADGVSSSTHPVAMAMFYTNGVHRNITIRNLTLDMNGQNNRISPAINLVRITAISCDGVSTCTVTASNSWTPNTDPTIYSAVYVWALSSSFGKQLNGRVFGISSVSRTGFTWTYPPGTRAPSGSGSESAAYGEALVRLNQPQIYVTGSVKGPNHLPAAALSNVLLENDVFVNSPGNTCIAMAQSNAPDAVLGSGWTLRNNTFSDNGLDSDDHSSVYGWANDVLAEKNRFISSTPIGISPISGRATHAGAKVTFEIHGSNTRYINNYINNYYQGVWVADNFSTQVTDTLIQGNRFDHVFIAVNFFDQTPTERGISGVIIEKNEIRFDDTKIVANPLVTLKAAVSIVPMYGISNVTVRDNQAYKTGNSIASAFALVGAPAIPGETTRGITITRNTATGMSIGAEISSHRGNLENVVDTYNDWIDVGRAGIISSGIGEYIRNLGPEDGVITGLTLGGGSVVKSTSSVGADYGVYIEGGSKNLVIDGLTLAPIKFIGVEKGNYVEAGYPKIMNRRGSIQ